MKSFWKCLYYVLCMLGCLLGAGFISGAEVVTFFVKFEYWGIGGIILSSVLFAIAVYKNSKPMIDQEECKNRINFLPYCQLFISGAMFAGLSKIISQLLGVSIYWIILAAGILLYISIVLGIKFANIFNIVVSVATIIILPFVATNIGVEKFNFGFQFKLFSSSIYAVLYAIINIVACMPIIKNIQHKYSKGVGVASGIISALLLGVIYLILSTNKVGSDMPILALLDSKILSVIYTIIFVVAMLSTMLSASSGAKQIFDKLQNKKLASLCTTLAIVSIGFCGFGSIINYVYPLIGVAFLIEIFFNKMYIRAQKTQKITK